MRTISRTRILIVCFLIVGICQSALAGGKSCGRCGSHKELKSVYRLVKICREIDMPEYAYTKQEVFYPDKGAVCYPGFHCDTFHTLWRNRALYRGQTLVYRGHRSIGVRPCLQFSWARIDCQDGTPPPHRIPKRDLPCNGSRQRAAGPVSW